MSPTDEPQCTCEATGVVHVWGAELIPDANCYYHGENGVNVVRINPKPAKQYAGTPYEIALAKDAEARRAEARFRPYDLTKREYEVVMLLWEGLDRHGVAERMTVTKSTIGSYLAKVHDKMGVRNDTQTIVKWAREQGVPDEPDPRDRMEEAEGDD
jgi:DNA-binding CsgD family transcriptional regulator